MRLILCLLFAILIAPSAAAPKAWAGTLLAEETGAADLHAAAPVDDEGNLLIAGVVMIGTPLYILLQVFTGISLTGRWRIAALIPVLPMGFAIGDALVAAATGSKLWPILVIVGAPLALLYLLALLRVRRLTRAAAAA